jgi:hypothetical protein
MVDDDFFPDDPELADQLLVDEHARFLAHAIDEDARLEVVRHVVPDCVVLVACLVHAVRRRFSDYPVIRKCSESK